MKKFFRISIVILLSLTCLTFGACARENTQTVAAPAAENLKKSVQELKYLIDHDPIVRMQFTQMIDQVPKYYKDNPEPYIYLESIDQMLTLINDTLTKAPEYNETELIGFPINTILNWAMGVPAGQAVFRNDKVNAVFKNILDEYKNFLDSKESLAVLNPNPPGGWMQPDVAENLHMSEYQYDPDAEHWGFTSWNDFFTRRLKPGVRPIDGIDNDTIIVSACDSEVYNIQNKVKKSDWFWIKAQPYSLQDMLAKPKDVTTQEHDKLVDKFVDGTVYQAFLSATKYHRWHSPVSGTIRKAFIKQGTYYSAVESEGMDPGSPDLSQGYLSHVATRGIVYIDADNPEIGLMAAMFIGMAEVSSCVFDKQIKPGYHIEKGKELGKFQYGGSTYCLIFRPGVIDNFTVEKGDEVKMGERIATVK